MLSFHLVLKKVVRINVFLYPSLLRSFKHWIQVLFSIIFVFSWAELLPSVCGVASVFSQEGSGLVGSEEAAASAQILPQVMRRSRHVGVTAEASGREPAPRGVRRPPAPKPEGSSSRWVFVQGDRRDDEMWAWEKPAEFGNVKMTRGKTTETLDFCTNFINKMSVCWFTQK